MESTYSLIWSDEALSNLKSIIDYLEHQWSEKEIKKFAQLLDNQLRLIATNPLLFPKSETLSGLRKSVLSRQTTIYYSINKSEIRIIALFDNRQNPTKLIDK